MIQKLSSLFQSKSPFLKQLQKLSLITECPAIDSDDILFLIDQFNMPKDQFKQKNKPSLSKQSIIEFLMFINERNIKSRSYIIQLKMLLIIHLLLLNIAVGKKFCKQFLLTKIQIHNNDSDANLYQIELIYYQYISKYCMDWNEINSKQPISNESFFYFNYVNLSNLVLSMMPYFKKYNKSPIFPLVKQMSLILYMDVEKFFKTLRFKIVDELRNLQNIGEKIIEVSQLFNELNILSARMLSFYQFILQFEEARKILPPKSLNISPQLQCEIMKLQECQIKKSERKKQLKLAYQRNQNKQNQSVELPIQSAKNSLKQDLSYQYYQREILTYRNQEKTINLKKFGLIKSKIPSRVTEENEKDIIGTTEMDHK